MQADALVVELVQAPKVKEFALRGLAAQVACTFCECAPRSRRCRTLVREQRLEQCAAPQLVDRFAQQLRAEYGVDVAALAH